MFLHFTVCNSSQGLLSSCSHKLCCFLFGNLVHTCQFFFVFSCLHMLCCSLFCNLFHKCCSLCCNLVCVCDCHVVSSCLCMLYLCLVIFYAYAVLFLCVFILSTYATISLLQCSCFNIIHISYVCYIVCVFFFFSE